MPPRKPAPPAHVAADPGGTPKENVIILGDDGKFYLVTKAVWSAQPTIPTTDPGYGALVTLEKNGVYLSYLPSAGGGGVGSVCTLVNLQSILKNQ
jgi:hypothetical protein